MDAVRVATLEPGVGLPGNANVGGRRQVTIIANERWTELMDALGIDLDPSTRRANLLVSGLDLQKSRGRVLKVGAARLRINGETRPCERMEEAASGLQAAMRERWGGGVFAEVIEGGEIRPGDPADWELPLLDRD
jgi:MOSC domain-containing protein YiiM